MHLRAVAGECESVIAYYAGTAGFTGRDFTARCRSYRALNDQERFRVQVILCGMRSLASKRTPRGATRFWTRRNAPT